MSLSKHIDPESLIEAAKDDPSLSLFHHRRKYHSHPHGGRYNIGDLPKYKLPQSGISGQQAYQLIKDEIDLDGKESLNLASFVHTWMPEEAGRLMAENVGKNLVDQDEYPATLDIHARCVSIIADLWKAEGKKAIGTACTGSSEGIMLGGLAMKRRWQEKMKKAGKDELRPGPNVIFGAEAQVCIEKFARYWDVEARTVPISKESRYVTDPKKVKGLVDENTIGVFVILGSTYTGHFEDVVGVNAVLDELEAEKGWDVPIHVDGASGAFFAPFAFPNLKWSFDVPRVVSINGSGHKYGMTYVGLGWVVWKSEEFLPKDLIFELHYLGSTEYSFNLNFSRPAAPVLAQYFNFINLGFEGYRNVQTDDLKNARLLSRALELSGYYEVLSDIHRPAPGRKAKAKGKEEEDETEAEAEYYMPGLPVVSFKWTDAFEKEYPHLEQRWVQTLLRVKGWIVPNYALAPNLGHIEILRVVVRESISEELIDRLVSDLIEITESLTDDSNAAQHLAALSTKADEEKGEEKEKGKGRGRRHAGHGDRKHAHPGTGKGTRATGFARQC